MRHALLIGLTRDRRSGARVLGPVLPADQAIKTIKELITRNECPDPRFPVVQAISLDSILREQVFRPTSEQIAAFEPEVPVAAGDDLNAALALNEQLTTDLEAQKVQVTELTDKLQAADDASARAIAALGEAQEAAQVSAARIADLEAQLAEKTAKKK